MRLAFNEYSEVIHEKFDQNTFMSFTALCIDTAKGKPKKYSVEEANDKIRATIKEMCGLDTEKIPSTREIKKAFRKSAVREAVFEIIEETIEDTLVSGWTTDPFFKRYVEVKNNALGQKNSFYTKDNVVLTVSEIANGHHNLERQRLGAGKEFTVKVKTYGMKVYMEMSRFIQGVEDWSELIGKISEAFTLKINNELHVNFLSAGNDLPVPAKWNVAGALNATNRKRFKQLISDVQIATGSKAVIVGTGVALGELVNLGDVQWISDEAKSDVYNLGRLGSFEGTPIIELPQVFAPDDVDTYLEDDTKLLILPNNIDKFIKMYYEGVEETLEKSEVGENGDDTKDYEFRVSFGIVTQTNVRFGTWTITN